MAEHFSQYNEKVLYLISKTFTVIRLREMNEWQTKKRLLARGKDDKSPFTQRGRIHIDRLVTNPKLKWNCDELWYFFPYNYCTFIFLLMCFLFFCDFAIIYCYCWNKEWNTETTILIFKRERSSKRFYISLFSAEVKSLELDSID